MSDTIFQECKKCHREDDCVEGVCLGCSVGEYFCEECGCCISEKQLEEGGLCGYCTLKLQYD